MALMQTIVVIKQMTGDILTYCKKCKKKVTISGFDDTGSYTKKCDCGCEVNQFHAPDEFHAEPFYTKLFISKKEFVANYKKKDPAEMLGFKKAIQADGSVKYVK